MMDSANPKIIPLPAAPVWRKRWTKTKYSNLVRYQNGNYYAYAMVCGCRVWKSLKTKSLEIAKLRLDSLLSSERTRLSKAQGESAESTFKAVADDWRANIESDPELKPRAKVHRLDTLKAVVTSWPALDMVEVKDITEQDCQAWGKQFRAKYSASRFNGALQSLRAVLALALKRGLITENPCKHLASASIKRTVKNLPTDAKFRLLLKNLKGHPRREAALLVVQFLAYSGRRIGSARQLKVQHINLKKGTINWPPIKYQQEFEEVPMVPQLIPVVKELLRIHPGDGSALIPIANPRRALRTCCRLAGIPTLTNHDLRHVFTTKALEAGIPVPDVAKLRGDADSGAMLLKNYFHSRIEHLRKVAKRVRV